MTRPTRTFDIRPDRYSEFKAADSAPEIELVFTHHVNDGNSSGTVESLTAEDLVALHRKLTLYINSVAGKEFLSDADITYTAKISSLPERHPEHEAARSSR